MGISQASFIRKIYYSFMDWSMKRLTPFSPTAVSKIRYKQALGKWPNLKNPTEFNEKLIWLKLNTYYKNPLVCQCADKVKVRDYVKKLGCSEILIDCLGIYETPSDIPWEALPKQFVLKCNHGSGYNIVCSDKNTLDIKETEKKLNAWLKEDYSLSFAEMQYHNIKPLIICEKYLQPASGFLPDDYKVYCYNGKAEYIMLCTERETGHCKYFLFDREWTLLKWILSTLHENKKTFAKPACLKSLLSYAEKLSAGFPFVRMDFYVMEDNVYFGEMTFTPLAGTDSDYTPEGNQALSDKIILPSTPK